MPAGPPAPPAADGPRQAVGAAAGALTRSWVLPFPVEVAATLAVHRRGARDPAFHVDGAGAVWRTSLTPDGPATIRVAGSTPSPPARPVGARPGAAGRWGRLDPGRWGPGPGDGAAPGGPGPAGAGGTASVHAAAWGPGARWLLESAPDLLGAADEDSGFDLAHPVLREVRRRRQGVRLGRSGRVMEALVPAVLEQKVVAAEAWRAWRVLLTRFGERAPGPAPQGMRVFPPPKVWARIPSWEWHRAGVEAVRARTIIGASQVAARLEQIVAAGPGRADRLLQTLPGVGVWTSAEVRQRACGDPDAVSVGDLHLCKAVGWVLAGRVVDDAGMLELLAPYAGNRHRVTRLVLLSGLRPPRRGPRLAPRDYRSF